MIPRPHTAPAPRCSRARSRPRPAAALALALAAALACAAPRTVVRAVPGRGAEIRLRVDGARSAALSGNMTGWTPVPLTREGGAFVAVLDLPPGRYEYRIEVVDGAGAHVVFPEGAERTPDGFGGENAVLRIR